MENNYHFDLIAQSIRFIKTNHIDQPNLDEIAAQVNLSKYHFQKLFQKWAGVSPKVFLQYTTIEQAKKSLHAGKSTLETAYEVGLSGNGRLHDLFLKMEACTPGEFRKRGDGLEINFEEIYTPFGKAIVAETEKGICKLSFTDGQTILEKDLEKEFANATFTKGLGKNGKLVQAFFKNWKIPKQKIGLDLQGTPFQVQVWKALLQIPSSQLLSYQDIAEKIQNPKATRAVGTAIGKNPIAYLIPCHRVIRQNGEMGGYRWKPERKIAMNGYECLNFSSKIAQESD
ncbi:MAG: bifunctional transcriptional activator/DNA repair enzyme AdaA [Saprospiraceae bacterium]